MNPQCTIKRGKKGNTAILRITGDVSAEAEEQFEIIHTGLLQDKVSYIVYDFSGMEYINSAGLAIILDFVTEKRDPAPHFGAFGMSDHFIKIIQMVGMDDFVTLFEKEKDALKHKKSAP